jgi:hypothetical protein
MKLREDILTGIGCVLGVLDGGCVGFDIHTPHTFIMIYRCVWIIMLTFGVYMYYCNTKAEAKQAQMNARAQRRQKIQNQWIKEYEQFRDEMHGKEKKD